MLIALCETNLENSIDSSNFYVRSKLSFFNSKRFALFLFLSGCTSVIVLRLPISVTVCFIVHNLQYLFIKHRQGSKQRWINPPANILAFGDFTGLYKDWWTYSYKTDTPGELLLFFLLKRPYSDVHLPYFLIYLCLPFSTVAFWQYIIMLLCQFPLTLFKFRGGGRVLPFII